METMEQGLMRQAYERAEGLMPWKMEGAVLNADPEIHWISDDVFCYASEEREGETVTKQYRRHFVPTGEETILTEDERRKYFPGKKQEKTSVLSNDGRMEAFARDDNLYLRFLKDGTERQITFDGEKDFAYGAEAEQINVVRERLAGKKPAAGVLWSHDSKKLLTYKLDLRGVKELYLIRSFDEEGNDSIRPELIRYKCSFPEDSHMPWAYFYIYDVETDTLTKVDAPPVAASHFVLHETYQMAQWLPDDSCIYYTPTERGDRDGYFYIVSPADGSARMLIHEHSDLFLNLGTYGQYDGYGAYPYSNFLTLDQKWVFWQSEREDLARLYRYDAQTGELLNAVTPKDSVAGIIIRVDEPGQWIYYMASGTSACSDPYYHVLCRVHFDGSGFQILTPEDGEHKVCMSSMYFVDTWSRVDQAPVTVIRRTDGSLVRTLMQADISELLKKGYQIPERFSVTASDGSTVLYGILIRPADFEEGKTYPVIDYIYGGMQCINVPKAFTFRCFGGREMIGGLQSFSQLGFAGFILDGLGTPGRGMKIHSVSCGNIHGCAGLKDHVYCLKELKEKFPFLDFGRLGIWGNSGGGCATARAMLEYPDVYKVGVSAAGNHDQRMYDNMWTERYYGLYDKELYLKGDNTALAGRLKGKLLIVHGAMDCNVSCSQSLRLADALIRADKDFDFLMLPRTNHNVPGNPYFIRRKLDYFVRYLLGKEPPGEFHFDVSNLLDLSV